MKNSTDGSLRVNVFILVMIYLLLISPLVLSTPYFLLIDFLTWNQDAIKLSECLHIAEFPCTSISKFPAGYLINAYVINFLQSFGIAPDVAIMVINFSFLLLPLFLLMALKGFRTACISGAIYTLSILFSPIPAYYVYSGGVEVQAGILTGLFISIFVILFNKHSVQSKFLTYIFLILSAVLFPLYKDVNLFLVLCSITAGLLLYSYTMNKKNILAIHNGLSTRFILVIIACFLTSVLISCSFNLARYGSIFPVAYMQEADLTSPDLFKSLEFFISIIISPNGGILMFWTASIVMALILIQSVGMKISKIAVFSSVFLIMFSIVGFSLWWAPFGWNSWGNRMMIPTMLSVLVIIICTVDSAVVKPLSINNIYATVKRNYESNNKFYLVKIIVTVFAILSFSYHLLPYFIDRSELAQNAMYSGEACNLMRNAAIEIVNSGNFDNFPISFWRSDIYYDCARERFLHFPGYYNLVN